MNARAGRRIVFRCDASDVIGGGHAMRCLTLANALAEAGLDVAFVAASMPDAIGERIAAAGHTLHRIAASAELQRDEAAWEEPPLSPDAQRADAAATEEAAGPADWIVVDHYLLDQEWHSAARRFGERILVIDDLANRAYGCDILLDQTFGRQPGDYRGLVPEGATVLAGSAYALLRPEFARERPAALERRKRGGPARRILVSMGTMDSGGITARIVEELLAAAPDCAIDAVVGSHAPSLDRVQDIAARDPRLSVHVNSDRMAELMRDADIAVGAAGTTSWERCCLGLPSVVLVLADNQRAGAAALDAASAAIAVERVDAIASAVSNLLQDSASLARMSAAAFAIADGLGTERVRDAMLGQAQRLAGSLALRAAGLGDATIAWLWRNDFTTRSLSQSSAVISWPDHLRWWQDALQSSGRHLFVAELAGAPVAVLRFDATADGRFEVSINLAPSARGHGLGEEILSEACKVFQQTHGPVPLLATIHQDNPASRRIFKKVGFVRAPALSSMPFERYVLGEGSAE